MRPATTPIACRIPTLEYAELRKKIKPLTISQWLKSKINQTTQNREVIKEVMVERPKYMVDGGNIELEKKHKLEIEKLEKQINDLRNENNKFAPPVEREQKRMAKSIDNFKWLIDKKLLACSGYSADFRYMLKSFRDEVFVDDFGRPYRV